MRKRRVRPEEPTTVRTNGGRQVIVDRLTLDKIAPIGRVILRITCRRAERDHVWTSLTAAEARQLAEHLMAQATAVERRCRPGHGAGD